jgi:hypothetical protein
MCIYPEPYRERNREREVVFSPSYTHKDTGGVFPITHTHTHTHTHAHAHAQVVFFPSYRYMEEVVGTWAKGKVLGAHISSTLATH